MWELVSKAKGPARALPSSWPFVLAVCLHLVLGWMVIPKGHGYGWTGLEKLVTWWCVSWLRSVMCVLQLLSEHSAMLLGWGPVSHIRALSFSSYAVTPISEHEIGPRCVYPRSLSPWITPFFCLFTHSIFLPIHNFVKKWSLLQSLLATYVPFLFVPFVFTFSKGKHCVKIVIAMIYCLLCIWIYAWDFKWKIICKNCHHWTYYMPGPMLSALQTSFNLYNKLMSTIIKSFL